MPALMNSVSKARDWALVRYITAISLGLWLSLLMRFWTLLTIERASSSGSSFWSNLRLSDLGSSFLVQIWFWAREELLLIRALAALRILGTERNDSERLTARAVRKCFLKPRMFLMSAWRQE